MAALRTCFFLFKPFLDARWVEVMRFAWQNHYLFRVLELVHADTTDFILKHTRFISVGLFKGGLSIVILFELLELVKGHFAKTVVYCFLGCRQLGELFWVTPLVAQTEEVTRSTANSKQTDDASFQCSHDIDKQQVSQNFLPFISRLSSAFFRVGDRTEQNCSPSCQKNEANLNHI